MGGCSCSKRTACNLSRPNFPQSNFMSASTYNREMNHLKERLEAKKDQKPAEYRFLSSKEGNDHLEKECARAGVPFNHREHNIGKLNQLIEMVEKLPTKGTADGAAAPKPATLKDSMTDTKLNATITAQSQQIAAFS